MENQEKEVARPLHELYGLLLEHMMSRDVPKISLSMYKLRGLSKVTGTEFDLMDKHFSDHFNEFNPDLNWSNVEAKEKRIDFIRKMIEITKPKN